MHMYGIGKFPKTQRNLHKYNFINNTGKHPQNIHVTMPSLIVQKGLRIMVLIYLHNYSLRLHSTIFPALNGTVETVSSFFKGVPVGFITLIPLDPTRLLHKSETTAQLVFGK